MNSVIGDVRMAELAVLGEVLEDLSLDELISYNGKFPLWKRIMVAINSIRVSLVTFFSCMSLGAHKPCVIINFLCVQVRMCGMLLLDCFKKV